MTHDKLLHIMADAIRADDEQAAERAARATGMRRALWVTKLTVDIVAIW